MFGFHFWRIRLSSAFWLCYHGVKNASLLSYKSWKANNGTRTPCKKLSKWNAILVSCRQRDKNRISFCGNVSFVIWDIILQLQTHTIKYFGKRLAWEWQKETLLPVYKRHLNNSRFHISRLRHPRGYIIRSMCYCQPQLCTMYIIHCCDQE